MTSRLPVWVLVCAARAAAAAPPDPVQVAESLRADPGQPGGDARLAWLLTDFAPPKHEAVALAQLVIAHRTNRADAIRALAMIDPQAALAALAAWRTAVGREIHTMHVLALELAIVADPRADHVREGSEALHYCAAAYPETELWCWRARTSATPGMDALRASLDWVRDPAIDHRTVDLDALSVETPIGNAIAHALRAADAACRVGAPTVVAVEIALDGVHAHAHDRAAAACVAAAIERASLGGDRPGTIRTQLQLREIAPAGWRRVALLAYATGVTIGGDRVVAGGGADFVADLGHLTDELVVAARVDGRLAGGAGSAHDIGDAGAYLGFTASRYLDFWVGARAYTREGAHAWTSAVELDAHVPIEPRVTAWVRAGPGEAVGIGATWPARFGVRLFTGVAYEHMDSGPSSLGVVVGIPLFDRRVW